METMPTNDVFHHLLLLLRLHNDKEMIVELFKKAGHDVSKAKIKSWSTTSSSASKDFRPMPTKILRDFISALHEAQLIDHD